MAEEKKGVSKIKLSKWVPISFAVFMLLYILFAIVLGKDSPAWTRLMQFAPYIFGSHSFVELFVAANKIMEKKKGLK